jgi:hypothetical protein
VSPLVGGGGNRGKPFTADYQITGNGSGIQWEWQLRDKASNTPIASGGPLASTSDANVITGIFAGSINPSPVASAVANANIMTVTAFADDQGFILSVGPMGNPTACDLSTVLGSCPFNPTIQLLSITALPATSGKAAIALVVGLGLAAAWLLRRRFTA